MTRSPSPTLYVAGVGDLLPVGDGFYQQPRLGIFALRGCWLNRLQPQLSAGGSPYAHTMFWLWNDPLETGRDQ
jgi:hypothetical protein